MIPDWMKYGVLGVAVLFVLGVAVSGIYRAGYNTAESKGQAALAELQAAQAQENEARWAVVAEVERATRERLQAEQARADTLAAKLGETENTLAQERRAFTKRIANATRSAPALTPESVSLYNAALYGAAGDSPGSQGDNPAGLALGSGAAPAPGSRILSEQPVSLADLLAHARDYGGWCRTLYARQRAWIDLSAGW